MANVYDLIDNMFDNAELSAESYDPTISTESDRPEYLPWHATKKNHVQRTFNLDTTATFIKDWKAATSEIFNTEDENYIELKDKLISKTNNGIAHPNSKYSKKKARRMEFQLSSSKRAKTHDCRVFYAILNKASKIYLLSIASQAEHHKDQKDLKAVSRADAEIAKLKENPL